MIHRRMIVRATAKLRDALELPVGVEPELTVAGETWYANLVKISRWRWLLLMHESTLFPAVIPGVRAADLRRFPELVRGGTEGAIADVGLQPASWALDPGELSVAPAADRSMLGFLNQMKVEIEYALWRTGANPEDVDVPRIHRQLAETPRRRQGTYVFAADLVRQRRSRDT